MKAEKPKTEVIEEPKVAKKPTKKTSKKKVKTDDSLLDMVIAFDTTGSMASYIEAVKVYVKELIPNLLKTNPNLMISIVAFGDYCDMPSAATFGNAYQVLQLTKNENDLIQFISTANNTNGGDGDEFYELVLHKIRTETDWRKDAKKAILLIADANPHKVGYSFKDIIQDNTISWKKEAKLLAEMGVQVDTLAIRPHILV